MHRELVLKNVIIIAVSLVIFFFLSLFVVNFVNRRNLNGQLESISKVIANDISQTNSESEIRAVVDKFTGDQQWLSIVIATSHGDIIIDSEKDGLPDGAYDSLEAFEMEKAGLVGNSGTLYEKDGRIFYIARLTDDIIFRSSVAMDASMNYILLGMFILAIVLMAVLILSIWLTGRTSAHVTGAFDRICSHLRLISNGENREISEDDKFEEVASAYRQINAVNKSIFQYITRISNERDKLNYIIDNINEGIIIISVSGIIYAANSYACTIFGAAGGVENSPYEEVIKDEKFRRMIAKELEAKTEIRFDYSNGQTGNIYLVSCNYFRHNRDITDEDLISIVLYDVTALRKEEQRKADFIASASHELKTPITSISGFSELLLSGLVPLPENIVEYVSNIHSESIRMKKTVEDLLYLSKLDNADELKTVSEVDLASLASTCIYVWRKSANEKNLTIKLEGNPVKIKGDVSLLTHLLGNLLDNAVKYNRNGGKITVTTGENDEGRKFIKVSDTGCGIEPQHLNNLFDRFYRVDNSRNRNTGGTGLGLTIVHKICELHRAEIRVESTFGKGTTFTVIFEKENYNA